MGEYGTKFIGHPNKGDKGGEAAYTAIEMVQKLELFNVTSAIFKKVLSRRLAVQALHQSAAEQTTN